MAQQTLTGNAKSLGALAAGGTITVSPAVYPQMISGVALSSVPVTGTIDPSTGNFSVAVTQGAKVKVKCKDGANKTFVDVVITISADSSANLSAYIPSDQTTANPVEPYVTSVNTRTGDVTLLVDDIPNLQASLDEKLIASVVSGNYTTTITNNGTAISITRTNTATLDVDATISISDNISINTFGDLALTSGTGKKISLNGNTCVESDGTLVFQNLASVFKDLTTPIVSAVTSGPGVSIVAAEQAAAFVAGATVPGDYLPLAYQINHDWKLGTTVYPHIHFEQTSANVPNWLIRYRWQTNGGAKVTAWIDYKCNTPTFTYVSGTLNQIAYGVGVTPPVGYGLSDIIQIQIFRDTTNVSTLFAGADPATGTINITSADIHYEIDTIGSRSEFTK